MRRTRDERRIRMGVGTTYLPNGGISYYRQATDARASGCRMMLLQRCLMVVLFVIPIMILALVAVVPAWPYNKNWGYFPSGGLGALLAITVVLLFLNRI